MEISETKFEELCRNSQKLDTVCDYIIERAEDDYDYVSTNILACMAGIGREAREAERKAKEAERAAKEAHDGE